eukprot:TRINITY_DN43763_c0_g1_i1.p2 TRINITY_DN43763_c0_g1~~TRINITY_DN43763_c0_g1_i1.p2  ORF type:complete len:141 (+),score=39.97 TRINITY_DN43763_c0_g1_i1:65-424(+)
MALYRYSGCAPGPDFHYRPEYEPEAGGHKSNSLEKELRDRGLHASANRVGQSGGAAIGGPPGSAREPVPGSAFVGYAAPHHFEPAYPTAHYSTALVGPSYHPYYLPPPVMPAPLPHYLH